MKVVLIAPPYSIDSDGARSEEIRFFPEGLASVAAALLGAGYEVAVLDLSQEGLRPDLIEDATVIGLTGMINQFRYLGGLIPELRRINPQAKIILGGPLVTSDPKLISRYLNFDFAVIGEGEVTIVELLENLQAPERVRGVAIKREEGIHLTPPRELLPPAQFLVPAFELFDLRWYLRGQPRHKPTIDTEKSTLNNPMFSRGCPNKCSFCCRILGNEIRCKQTSQIERELGIWYEAGMRFFRCQDDNFFLLPKEMLEHLFNLFKDFNLKWAYNSRVDIVTKDKLERAKEAGLTTIFYGIESLSSEALRRAGKRTTPEQARAAIELTEAAGIQPAAFFLLGLPGETKESLEEMVEFTKRHQLLVTPYILCPLPGTRLFEEIKPRISNMREFLDWCGNWEERQIGEGQLYLNLSGLSDQLILETYIELQGLALGHPNQ